MGQNVIVRAKENEVPNKNNSTFCKTNQKNGRIMTGASRFTSVHARVENSFVFAVP